LRLILLPALVAAMPQKPEFVELLRKANAGELTPCNSEACAKPVRKYEVIQDVQPGMQWGDHGGYCGSWATQRATLAKGAWVSQQQVRDHTVNGGGPNDHEILASNIGLAMTNLKIKHDCFDWRTTPAPQQGAYFKWLKKHLVAGNAVAWFIMWDGEAYPLYTLKVPDGLYGHVEPVIGIMSNHPFTDETVYDDDVVVHYNDAGTDTFYKNFSMLPGNWSGKKGDPAVCQKVPGVDGQCTGPYAYGCAVLGFEDEKETLPLSLSLDPWQSEPDTRTGSKPNEITGKLSIKGLTTGTTYDIYRWNDVKEAFTYTDNYKIKTFEASGDVFVYTDPKNFSSASATYYSCVKASGDSVVV